LQLNALFRLLGANFFGTLIQARFVLLKRDPDNQITTDNLTTELSLARACFTILGQRRSRGRKVAQTIAFSVDLGYARRGITHPCTTT
jgi:hypothetical protein